MKFRLSFYWLLLLIPALFIGWYLMSEADNKPRWTLPYFGPRHAEKKDTLYHSVPAFEFTSQYNEPVDLATVKGKIFVTEFFFSTCQSICPVMNNNLTKIYQEFGQRDDFLILSHTVDPETDSVAVLKDYAEAHGVKDKKWLFVTGTKPELYHMARKGYLLNADNGKGDADDFIHTQNFALVDKDLHIRGFYDGTDSLEMNRLNKEIKTLFQEYDYRENSDR
jgi:protein SCO1